MTSSAFSFSYFFSVAGGDGLALLQVLEALLLHLMQLGIGLGDVLEHQQHGRHQRDFHRGQGDAVILGALFAFAFGAGAFTVGFAFGLLAAFPALGLLFGLLAGGFHGGLFLALDLGFDQLGVEALLAFAAIGGVEIDDVAQQHLAFDQGVMPLDDGADGHRAFADAADHHLAAGFDALGDGDFALARQQLDRAHLAQIHAHRVVGAAQILFVDIAGGADFALGGFFLADRLRLGFLALFALDQVDAHFGQHRHRIFDLLGRHLVRRHGGIQFVIGDVTALFPARDQLLDRNTKGIQERPVEGFFLGVGHFRGIRHLARH